MVLLEVTMTMPLITITTIQIYSKVLVLLLSFTITIVAIIMLTIKILLLQVEEFEKYSHASHIGAFDLIHMFPSHAEELLPKFRNSQFIGFPMSLIHLLHFLI